MNIYMYSGKENLKNGTSILILSRMHNFKKQVMNGTAGDFESSFNFRLQSQVMMVSCCFNFLSDFNSTLKETKLFSFYNNLKRKRNIQLTIPAEE